MKKILLAALLLPSLALGDVVLKSGASSSTATVYPAYSALAVAVMPRSKDCHSISATSGTIAAAATANSSFFAMRISPTGGKTAYIYRIAYEFQDIVAFTTAITAGRRLSVFRGAGAAASGQTATVPVKKDSAGGATSQVEIAQGGDSRIANTGALTVTGITYETTSTFECPLVNVGAAGAYKMCEWVVNVNNSHPIELEPGQLLAIRNPAAMDAAGTWTLTVNVEWCEY